MRALLQRVTHASVSVENEPLGRIQSGLVVLGGIAADDAEADAAYLTEKLTNLRIFPYAEGRFNLSALDVKAELLLISQFTLYADTRKGRRPSFTTPAPPDLAAPLFERFIALSRETGLRVETGRFHAHMLVEIHNDGPVTVLLDSADRHRPRSA